MQDNDIQSTYFVILKSFTSQLNSFTNPVVLHVVCGFKNTMVSI